MTWPGASQLDSYRPHEFDGKPPLPSPDAARAMFEFRGDRRNEREEQSRGTFRDKRRPEFTFRARPKAHERPLLRGQGNRHEERMMTSDKSSTRFRDLADLTDSDEAAMEEDSTDERDEHDVPPAKRVKAVSDHAPKWSNPDPYTALPAPNDTTNKRIDFVRLIRKARKDTEKQPAGALSGVDDFISFGPEDQGDAPPADAPTAPRALQQQQQQLPPPPPHLDKIQDDNAGVLGKRKRGEKLARPSLKGAPGRQYYSDGTVLPEWQTTPGTDAAPWCVSHHETSAGIALHKEVLDFYQWVRPREYEAKVRAEALQRIDSCLRRLRPGRLKAFGSYAAGLYLPTGDMDVVYLLNTFVPSVKGAASLPLPLAKSQIWKWADHIRRSDLAKTGTVTPITHAKVPIIKFVERVSGLKVDLSFNNDTGVVAVETFDRWQRDFPAMPILVSVVKQLLMIRGLNDVSVGGLGGFSIICLVTSLLQLMPSRRLPYNLGEILLEFFNLYGKQFNLEDTAIRLDPPGYVNKHQYAPHFFNAEKPGRLAIIDPNQPANNISGGSSEVKLVLRCFAQAHDTLQDKLREYHRDVPAGRFSFLVDLIGGNLTTYDVQRDLLYRLHHGPDGLTAPAVHAPLPRPRPPHPPPPPGQAGPPSMPSSSADSSDVFTPPTTETQPHLTPAKRRALQMKRLRPELSSQIGAKLNRPNAVRIGGYKDVPEMKADLARREQAAMVQ